MTPPAIAPACDLFFPVAVVDGMPELAPLDAVPFGGGNSVLLCVLSIQAAVALSESDNVTSRNAHAGIAVPFDMGLGNLWTAHQFASTIGLRESTHRCLEV